MKKVAGVINKIFGWGIYICLFLGGLSFFGFVIALIIGGGEGGTGEAIAVFLHKQYFPVIIRVAAIMIILGLIAMYLNREQALSMKTDKAEADADIALAHAQEVQEREHEEKERKKHHEEDESKEE